VVAVALLWPGASLAAECRSAEMPAPIIELIKAEKYAEAETQASAALAKTPDDLASHRLLANVYINSALRSGINIDTTQLGFKPGESGARQVTYDQVKAATSPGMFVDPAYRKKAEAHIEAMLQRWPGEVDYFYCLTKIQYYAGDHASFIRYLDRTARSHAGEEKEAVDFLITYGVDYLEAGRHREAVAVYETLLKTFPRSAPALSSLGVVWLKRGDSAKAASFFDRAYAVDPKDVIVVGNIAEMSMLRGDFKRAEDFCKRKLMLYPRYQSATLFDLAMIAMNRGAKASLPYWEKYRARIKEEPDDAYWSQAAEGIYQAIRNGTLDDAGYLDLALQMIQANAPKYVVPLMFRMKEKDPRDASYTYALAQAYDIGGYYDLGERAIAETLVLKKQNPESLAGTVAQISYNHSRLLYQLERRDDALAALENIKTGDDVYPNALYMRGMIFRDQGKREQARRQLQQCVDLAGENPIKTSCENLLAGLG
jgi:tetratricopeptide (TPR) repeat protein